MLPGSVQNPCPSIVVVPDIHILTLKGLQDVAALYNANYFNVRGPWIYRQRNVSKTHKYVFEGPGLSQSRNAALGELCAKSALGGKRRTRAEKEYRL